MKDKLDKIKYSRLQPYEKWFVDMLDNIEERKSDLYPNDTFFMLNGFIIFWYVYDTKVLNFSTSFYNFLNKSYKDEKDTPDNEIKLFVKNRISNGFKIDIETVLPYNLDAHAFKTLIPMNLEDKYNGRR